MKKLLDAGLCATVNSDDPAYFGGYLNANFVQTVEALNLSRGDVVTLARNSFEASFIDATTRSKYLAQIEALMR
jgi:adenosine deaminase